MDKLCILIVVLPAPLSIVSNALDFPEFIIDEFALHAEAKLVEYSGTIVISYHLY